MNKQNNFSRTLLLNKSVKKNVEEKKQTTALAMHVTDFSQ